MSRSLGFRAWGVGVYYNGYCKVTVKLAMSQ